MIWFYGSFLSKNSFLNDLEAVSGGCSNLAGSGTLSVNAFCTETSRTNEFASVLGGIGNQAEAESSSVTGGSRGKATYRASTVLGGLEEVTEAEFGVTP